MKRFVTYLYAYKNGQKIKNTGYIRVDVRGHILDMQVNIKDMDLSDVKGLFYILIKKETIIQIPLLQIEMQAGQYRGKITCDCEKKECTPFAFEDIIGVSVCYDNDGYMASCWKEGEEAVLAEGKVVEDEKDDVLEGEEIMQGTDDMEVMLAVSLEETSEEKTAYRKLNLNDIYILPSNYWRFSNNSFLLHGFWNYGYLVLKENMEENNKRIALGIPGVFEQPEMVMAAYFGFPKFEVLPSQATEIEIGQFCVCNLEEKGQQPQDGTFGCWFVDLYMDDRSNQAILDMISPGAM